MGEYPGDFPMGDYLQPPEPPQRRRISRKTMVIGCGAIAAVVIAAGAALALTQNGQAPAPRPTAVPTAKPQLANINSVQTDPKPITGQ
jgi:hypothetical protein